MDWPKMRRRSKEDKINIAVDELLIRIETNVAPIIADLRAIPIGVIVGTQVVTTTIEPIAKDIGQCDNAHLIAGLEDVNSGAGSAVAATDQPGSELIGPGAVG